MASTNYITWENWTKEIKWTYGFFRKSDLFVYILPGFYLTFIIFIFVILKTNYLKVFLDYENNWFVLTLFVLLLLILVYILWIILNNLAWVVFVKIFDYPDQTFWTKIFKISCDWNESKSKYWETVLEHLDKLIYSYNKIFSVEIDKSNFFW